MLRLWRRKGAQDPQQNSDPVSHMFRIEEQARKLVNSSGLLVIQLDFLLRAFAVVTYCLKEWQSLDVTSIKRDPELLFIMQSGMQMIQDFVKEKKSWAVRTLLIEQELKLLFRRLQYCLHFLSISVLNAQVPGPTKSRLMVLCLSSISDIYYLANKLDAAIVIDRNHVHKWIEEDFKRKKLSGYKDLLNMLLPGETSEETFPDHLRIKHEHLELKRHIGSGSFGAVYEALWFNHVVAVKVFRKGDLSFDKELSAMVTLRKHPNVVSIIGYSQDPRTKQYSIVMKRMTMDLTSFIEEWKNMSLVMSISIMLQIAEGMEFLHSKNVIHRDLKPANILVKLEDPDNPYVTVKISDFGTARLHYFTSQLTSVTAGVGTKWYRAPEVFRMAGETEEKKYSKKADVYSFSMVCYHIITGTAPFEDVCARPDFGEMVCFQNWRPELPKNCPEGLSTLLKDCWSEDVDTRPSFSQICGTLQRLKSYVLTGSTWWCDLRCVSFFPDVMILSLAEIKKACNNFGELIGGSTYRGVLTTKEEVAVEILDLRTLFSQTGFRLLSRLKHDNVVRQYAFCNEKGEAITVSQYMSNGTLDSHLHELGWEKRLDIAIQVASAISYLHSLHIIHSNVQPRFIFLDDNLEAKLGGLKFSSLCEDKVKIISPGYDDAETSLTGVYTPWSDVYSFGATLLTMAASVDKQQTGVRHFKGQGLEHFLSDCVDDEFKQSVDRSILLRYLHLVKLCLQPSEKRPGIDYVIQTLLSIRDDGRNAP